MATPTEPATPPPLWASLRTEGYRCATAQWRALHEPYTRLQALRLALCPVDLWRYHEFGAVLAAYRGETPILDIGSPRLLARYLTRHHRCRVLSMDISPRIGSEIRLYRRGFAGALLHGTRADATALPIADNTIPFAYSVSVIEHIGGNGDSRALSEVARVLAPGGRCVITVPCADSHREIWLDHDAFGAQPSADGQGYFFSYLYDWQSIAERLAPPTGLVIEDARAWRVRDLHAFLRYKTATTAPRSLASIRAKWSDCRYARTLIEPCKPFAEPSPTHGVAMLTYRKKA